MSEQKSITILVCVPEKDKLAGEQFIQKEAEKISFLNPKTKLISSLKSIAEYSKFCVKDLINEFDTDFCLVEQLDGYILNADAWTNDFFNYDYIGAPWNLFKQLNYVSNDKNDLVGNGGFSLRSRKIQTILASSFSNDYNGEAEDVYICQTKRRLLESQGVVFAPHEVASKFSVENNFYVGQFGFHEGFIFNNRYYRIDN